MNKFEVDSKGKVFINGMLIEAVSEYKMNAVGFGISEITLKFDADEAGIRTTKKEEDAHMNFGQAIEALKQGKKVARAGWNGKGMFLYYVPAASYSPSTHIAKETFGGKDVPYGAYIAMKTAQGNVVPWLASQTDMLAEDWTIV